MDSTNEEGILLEDLAEHHFLMFEQLGIVEDAEKAYDLYMQLAAWSEGEKAAELYLESAQIAKVLKEEDSEYRTEWILRETRSLIYAADSLPAENANEKYKAAAIVLRELTDRDPGNINYRKLRRAIELGSLEASILAKKERIEPQCRSAFRNCAEAFDMGEGETFLGVEERERAREIWYGTFRAGFDMAEDQNHRMVLGTYLANATRKTVDRESSSEYARSAFRDLTAFFSKPGTKVNDKFVNALVDLANHLGMTF